MTRIGPALAVIAAATTPDERARAGGGCARAVRARGATARPRHGGTTKALALMGALIILNTRNRNSGLPTR